MGDIEYYMRKLNSNTWENDLNQLTKIITVLTMYSTYHGKYHIGINEISRYLYIMDHPTSITNAYNPDLEKSYAYALNFLGDGGRNKTDDYKERYSAIVYVISKKLKLQWKDTYSLQNKG
jgi:hypothetical protein